MKKIYIIFALLVLIMPSFVFATNYVEITGDIVRVRTSPSTNSSILTSSNSGTRYTLKDTSLVSDQGGCSAGWYKIDYNGQDAYVCSEYSRTIINDSNMSEEAKSACEKELSAAGFPESYWSSLCNLKNIHPSWTFVAVNTGLDFQTSVNRESACGKNSIVKTSQTNYQDTSCSGTSYDSGYTGASNEAVAYYMNPLNFLSEDAIFMFESARANNNISQSDYLTLINKIFNNNFLVQQINYLPELIYNAGTCGLSPTSIATRIKQELGNGKLTSGNYAGQLYSCVSGNYTSRFGYTYNGKSYDNYYNFYNIGASDGSGITQKALNYAVTHGWGGTGDQYKDRGTAVTGGASWIYERFISRGQDTIYFQKFNVHPTNSSQLYVNQYMTNVQAALSEGKILYQTYANSNLLNLGFVFYIPIYNGNTTNNVKNETNGAQEDKKDDNTKQEDKPEEVKVDPSTLVVGAGYRLSNDYMYGINPGTQVNDVIASINSVGGTTKVYNGNNEVTSGNIGTNMKVVVTSNAGSKEYKVVIKGDTSGDGIINALDLLQIQKNILNLNSLNDSAMLAGDTSGDGKINALDLLQVQKSILKLYIINQ